MIFRREMIFPLYLDSTLALKFRLETNFKILHQLNIIAEYYLTFTKIRSKISYYSSLSSTGRCGRHINKVK